jgi:hypothetical protein
LHLETQQEELVYTSPENNGVCQATEKVEILSIEQTNYSLNRFEIHGMHQHSDNHNKQTSKMVKDILQIQCEVLTYQKIEEHHS